jgi:hypothetical protein
VDNLNSKIENLENHILLVVKTNECGACLEELKWWNSNGQHRFKNRKITLVVIDRHKKSYDAFVKYQNINLSAVHDSTANIIKNNIIPRTPIKIFFNSKEEISVIDYMGKEGNISQFINKVRDN